MSPEHCSNDNGSELQVTGGNSCMQVKHSTDAWPNISHGLQSSSNWDTIVDIGKYVSFSPAYFPISWIM